MIAKLFFIRLLGCGCSSILIRLLRLPGGASLSLQLGLDVSFGSLAHIACSFQLWHEVRYQIARTSPDKSRNCQNLLQPQPPALHYILSTKRIYYVVEAFAEHELGLLRLIGMVRAIKQKSDLLAGAAFS